MDSAAATLTIPPDDWAEVERWTLRAQALAELRALSEGEPTGGAPVRSIRLPSAERPTGQLRSLR